MLRKETQVSGNSQELTNLSQFTELLLQAKTPRDGPLVPWAMSGNVRLWFLLSALLHADTWNNWEEGKEQLTFRPRAPYSQTFLL